MMQESLEGVADAGTPVVASVPETSARSLAHSAGDHELGRARCRARAGRRDAWHYFTTALRLAFPCVPRSRSML
jgi:hypothetical protein